MIFKKCEEDQSMFYYSRLKRKVFLFSLIIGYLDTLGTMGLSQSAVKMQQYFY